MGARDGFPRYRQKFVTRMTKASLVIALLAAALLLSSCASYSEDDVKEPVCQFGETVSIEYEYSLLGLYEKGPYSLEITPQGFERLTIGGKDVDCAVIDILVVSTNDGEPADYANCMSAIDFLNKELDDVSYSAWYKDHEGTKEDPRDGRLDIGVTYTYWAPLTKSLAESGLAYITVSDRSGYKSRSGTTYWYDVSSLNQ